MKRRHITQLWIEIFRDHRLSGLLSIGAAVFFCLMSLKWEIWPLIIAGVVLALFTTSLMKDVIWGIRATRAFLSSVPVPAEVKFFIDWELPPGYVGCPQGPTPCYAILKSDGFEQRVRILDPRTQLILVISATDIQANGRSFAWEFLFGLESRKGRVMVSLFPDINAQDVESAAVHVKRRTQGSDGKPFVQITRLSLGHWI